MIHIFNWGNKLYLDDYWKDNRRNVRKISTKRWGMKGGCGFDVYTPWAGKDVDMNDANFIAHKQYARYWIDVDTVYGVILRVKKQDWSIGTPDIETGKFLVTNPANPVDKISKINLEFRDERALLRMFPEGFYLFDPSNKNYDKFNAFYRIKGHEMEDQVIGEDWKKYLDNTKDVWKSLVCDNENVMPDGTKLKVNENYLGCNTYNIDLEKNLRVNQDYKKSIRFILKCLCRS